MGSCISRVESSPGGQTGPRTAWEEKCADSTFPILPTQPSPAMVSIPPIQPANESLLISAVIDGELDMVKRILSRGVEKAWVDKAFLVAVEKGQLPIAAHLGLNGADVNAQNGKALMSAALRGNLTMVMLLVSLGANINERKGSAFMYSIEEHHMGVARYLCFQGIRVSRYELLLTLQEPPCHMKCDAWKLGCEFGMRSKKTYDLGNSDTMRMVAKYL